MRVRPAWFLFPNTAARSTADNRCDLTHRHRAMWPRWLTMFFWGGSVWIPKGIWLVAIKRTDESNRTKLRSNTISSQISSLVMMSSSFGKSGQGEKLLTVNQGLPLWALHLPLMATLKQALCCNVKSLQKWCCQSSIPPTHVPMILRANYGHDFRCTLSLNQNCRF